MADINAPSPLLGLPPELRNKIYEHLLQRTGREIDYQGWLHIQADGRSWDKSYMMPIFPQILRTCRQIHHEARAVLYGENRFQFTGTKEVWNMSDFSQPKEIERFLDIIGFSNAAIIKRMRVYTAWTMEREEKFRFFLERRDDTGRTLLSLSY
ncbi:hypothetical protein P7C71_g5830, partial [Lecanoromycetidae sp. Uapishka_2]